MRLKSKYVTLFALIILTATPRAFEQLTDLKDFAQERFRAELRNIFWSFTTPESRRGDAKQYSELLARMQQTSAPACNGTDEIRMARGNRTNGGLTRSTPNAAALGHRQPFALDEPSELNLVADANMFEPDLSVEFSTADEMADADKKEIALVARNFSDYPLFDETYGPVHIDDPVAQLEWNQEAEPSVQPHARPVVLPKREAPGAQRFVQKFVQTNFQMRLTEKLDVLRNTTLINSDAFIKIHTAPAPAKPKCSAPVTPVAPEEAPRPLEKPALIS